MSKQIIFLIILYILIINYVIIQIYINDIYFIIKRNFYYSYELDKNIITNNVNINNEKINNTKILIVSFDNRKNLEYIKIHNKNVNDYCKLWKNIEYEFVDVYDDNIYWYKLILVLEKLKSNKYDYVMWMDSDTIIVNPNLSLNKIINSYSSDIFIGHDKPFYYFNSLCSGVFIIKNSKIGINFIEDCINYYKNSKCKISNFKLNGIYAQMCYEQGVMNYFIYEKYLKYTTVLNSDIINNDYECYKNTFILHKYGSTEQELNNCFKSILNL
jgi:hypothetical protein